MYSCNKKWHWVERAYKATVISSQLCHYSVVQLYYLLRLWQCVLRLLGSLRTNKTCLRHRRLLKRTMSSLERSSLQLKLCCLRTDLWDLKNSLRSWCFDCFDSRISISLLLLRFRSHSLPSPSDAVHSERRHVDKFPPLSFLLLGTSCLGRSSGDDLRSPFGRLAVRRRGYGLRSSIFKSRSSFTLACAQTKLNSG